MVSRALLLLVFLGLFFISLMIVSNVAINFHISTYGRKEGIAAMLVVTVVIAGAFVFSRFSFGYLAGFYLFAMMAGYFWFNIFGTLGYDRRVALISAIASIVLFLAPVLLITRPARRFFTLPHAVLDLLPACIFLLSAVVFLLTALNGVRLAGLTDMYKYRATLHHSQLFEYFVGIFYGALLPFTFACSLARKRWLMLLALCALSLLFYTVTLTKVSLFVSSLLIFFAILSAYFEARAAVILSLLLPTAAPPCATIQFGCCVRGVRVSELPDAGHSIDLARPLLRLFCRSPADPLLPALVHEGYHGLPVLGSTRCRTGELVSFGQFECVAVCDRGGRIGWCAVRADFRAGLRPDTCDRQQRQRRPPETVYLCFGRHDPPHSAQRAACDDIAVARIGPSFPALVRHAARLFRTAPGGAAARGFRCGKRANLAPVRVGATE
jgi:hypothetical protein